jgi:hypothetical protein
LEKKLSWKENRELHRLALKNKTEKWNRLKSLITVFVLGQSLIAVITHVSILDAPLQKYDGLQQKERSIRKPQHPWTMAAPSTEQLQHWW